MPAALGITTCCGGYSLRAGTLLILWLYAICGTLYGTLQFGILYGTERGKAEIWKNCLNYTEKTEPSTFFFKPILTNVNNYKYLALAFPSYLAAYGVYKRKPPLIYPFFLFLALVLILIIIDIVVDIISYSIDKKVDTLGDILRAIIEFMIGSYFYLIIYNHYREIQDHLKSEQNLNTATNISDSRSIDLPPS